MPKKFTDEQIINAYIKFGLRGGARHIGLEHNNFLRRVKFIERITGTVLMAENAEMYPDRRSRPVGFENHPGKIKAQIHEGHVLVGSDAHIWPGVTTPAMRAFWQMVTLLRRDLKLVCLNGDVVDASTLSGHALIGWEHRPNIVDEIAEAQRQLREIQRRAVKEARFVWLLGNHDSRFENKIANTTPQLIGVSGVSLKDHFPTWEPGWSLWVNEDVCIKHRYRGGIHATWNNTIYAGATMVTGHLHSLRVTPFSDYYGTRWGVDSGTLATPYSPPFINYTEANPVNWRAGGVVLTFVNGRLLWPELFALVDEHSFEFRGKIHELST